MLARANSAILLASAALLVSALASSPAAGAAPPGENSTKDKNLVACWNCEPPRGERIDNCAGGGLPGTNHGARWLNGALDFDGVGDYVSVGSFRKLASLATGTISVWFKARSARFGECVQPVFYFGDADGGSDNSSLVIELGHFWPDQKTTALYFTIYGVPGQRPTFCFDTKFDLELNAWYHFVAVVGNGFNTGYLNGVELLGRNYNFGGPHDTVFFDDVVGPGTCLIGKGWFWTFPDPCYFDGRIGEVRVYDRPLDQSQVRRLYDEGRRDLHGEETAARSPSLEARPDRAPAGALLTIGPNPFNPATRIRFTLAERSTVALRVFRSDGSLVATLLHGEVEAGTREIAWDGRDGSGRPSASGVYFCRLEAGSQSATKKLVLGK